MRVPLDAQNWAEIKEVSELSKGDRTAVNEFIVSEYDPVTGHLVMKASVDDQMSAALLHRICTDWSLPFHNPSTDPSSLDRLTLEQDDNLRKAIQPHIDALRGVNAPVKDNEVPTVSSKS